ncbi:TPA: ead/Ea22-like family protein [Klebsiella pneumoniae]
MTGITELSLLVSKAKASVFTLEYISQFEPADIDSDDVDLRFEVDGRDTGTNVSIVDECGQAAKVIGTLVEALEKAQGMEAYWKTQCRGITDHCEVLQARIAELEEAEQKLCAANVTLDARAEFAEHQLAGLESRLDSADKLQDSAFRSGLQHGFSLGQTDDQKGYEHSMAAYSLAAGIKVEAE